MRIVTCLFLLFLLVPPADLSAQTPANRSLPGLGLPKVSESWVDMGSYEPAPEAPAAILLDQGALHFDELRFRLRFLYHYSRAIKVFDKTGAEEFREVRIRSGPDEEIIQVMGAVFRRFGDSTPVTRLKVTRDMIQTIENPDGSSERIIRFPRVAPGVVITYAWAVSTTNYSRIRPWNFQQAIPVRESHFETYVPRDFLVLALLQGEIGDFETDSKKVPGRLYFKATRNAQSEARIQALPTGVGPPQDIIVTDYSMTNLTSLKAEPLMGTPTDVQVRLLLQLQGLALPSMVNNWSSDWQELLRFLDRHSRVGNLTRPRQVVKKWLESQGAPLRQPASREHLAQLVNTVRNGIAWNGAFDVLGSQSSRELLRNGKGNSADINLLLVAVLDLAGYKARPLLACTRSHGRLMKPYPVLSQFNHVVVEVRLKGQSVYLDASQDRLPVGLLPLNLLREEAMRLNYRKPRWVSLDNGLIRQRHTLAFFQLDPAKGVIDGKLRHLDRGYSALKTQTLLNQYQDDLDRYFREHMLAEFPDANMEGHVVKTEQRGDQEAIYTRVEMVTQDYITQGDSLILIEPLLSEAYPENPLTQKDRSAPIDFGSPIKEEFVLLLTIPDGYEFAVIPETTAVALPHQSGLFLYKYQIVNQTLQLLSRIQINRTEFPAAYYETLSEFFDHIAAKHGQRVIIRKKG